MSTKGALNSIKQEATYPTFRGAEMVLWKESEDICSCAGIFDDILALPQKFNIILWASGLFLGAKGAVKKVP